MAIDTKQMIASKLFELLDHEKPETSPLNGLLRSAASAARLSITTSRTSWM